MVGRSTEDGVLRKVGHDSCQPVLSRSPFARSPELLMTSIYQALPQESEIEHDFYD